PGKTWIWNGSTWSEPKLSTNPPLRIGASAAYDPGRGADVLFGGLGSAGKLLSDAWAWSGKSWSRLTEKTAPPVRAEAVMAYDASSNKLLLFGGSIQVISVGKGKNDLADSWLGGP
ncbi:MAG TPA: kelch repeat-containing protein, partial [Acidimicrobiales bacterium]|nr:kelch repeat-containing protein [Acidimicrobiales bacterium]